MSWIRKLACVLMVLPLSATLVRAQSAEERTVETANEVLHEIMDIPANCIPASLLAKSQAVVIIPGMVKGGFIVGIRHGKGVVLTRNQAGEWTAPVFVSVTGGSVGLQAGLQATDVIAVFRNRGGVDRLMRGKLTLGADASVAAGPVGRDASAATDAQLKAEILSYSRSRGLFAGVAIDGAVMQIDHHATAAYYAPKIGAPPGAVPVSAVKLVEQIVAYSEPQKKKVVLIKEQPFIPPQPQADYTDTVRAQLAESSLHLHKILDARWREYLSLPSEVYTEGKAPSPQTLAQCVGRYETIIKDARYQNLTASAEFRETHSLLMRYRTALEGKRSNELNLPPPPPK